MAIDARTLADLEHLGAVVARQRAQLLAAQRKNPIAFAFIDGGFTSHLRMIAFGLSTNGSQPCADFDAWIVEYLRNNPRRFWSWSERSST